jgi:hypothetical protein
MKGIVCPGSGATAFAGESHHLCSSCAEFIWVRKDRRAMKHYYDPSEVDVAAVERIRRARGIGK